MAEGAFFEKFECAPGLRMQSNEQLAQLHYENINRRLEKLEELMERLEKRLWLTVYGVVAVILAQAFQSVLAVTP
ncbi:MAG: hypothetical protein AAFY38_02525 [Pseudomonadota bacterium]